jgi:hypothetical protein
MACVTLSRKRLSASFSAQALADKLFHASRTMKQHAKAGSQLAAVCATLPCADLVSTIITHYRVLCVPSGGYL